MPFYSIVAINCKCDVIAVWIKQYL